MSAETVTFTLFSSTFYPSEQQEEGPPVCAIELIAWLKAFVAQVPEDYRASIKFELETGWDSGNIEAKVTWSRPETDAEAQARIQEDAERHERSMLATERNERATLARLKAKYEAGK